MTEREGKSWGANQSGANLSTAQCSTQGRRQALRLFRSAKSPVETATSVKFDMAAKWWPTRDGSAGVGRQLSITKQAGLSTRSERVPSSTAFTYSNTTRPIYLRNAFVVACRNGKETDVYKRTSSREYFEPYPQRLERILKEATNGTRTNQSAGKTSIAKNLEAEIGLVA